MKDHSYEGYEIDTFDIEDGQIIIQLQDGPKLTLTATEDHGYPMIEIDEENHVK